MRGRAARARAAELLDMVGIPDARRRLSSYPHEFSGGMRQRAMLAIALAAGPKLLLADEPTTALDVTIQDQILKLLLRLRRELSMSIVLVTHDLGIIAETCDRVAVLYSGRMMETGPVETILARPAHPYTLGLINSVPQAQGMRASIWQRFRVRPPDPLASSAWLPLRAALHPGKSGLRCANSPTCAHLPQITRPPALSPCRGAARAQLRVMMADALLRADDLVRSFPVRGLAWHGRRPVVRALNGVTLSVARGETLAVVGESGCGKSTLARALVRLIELDSGQIQFAGEDVRALQGDALRRYNRHVQLVFQDPYGSLNPRMTVGEMLEEASTGAPDRRRHPAGQRVSQNCCHWRGCRAAPRERLPHEFSGGQRQRIAIARALSVQPDMLIADEIVSALDVSVQAQILNLLLDLQRDLGLAILFVSHDLRVVRHLAHRVAVMYLGRVVEVGDADAVFASPLHPYTQALLRAAPQMRVGRRNENVALAGELPSPLAIPAGCPFHPRCPLAFDRCRVEAPALHVGTGRPPS